MKNNVTSFVIIDRLEGTDFFIVTHQRNKSWMVVNRTFRDLLLLQDGTRSIDEIVALMGPRFKEKDFAKFLTVLQKNLGIAYENEIFVSRAVYEKTDILYQKPSSIYIELTNKCNLSCKYCYLSGNLKNSRMFSLDLCKKLLSDVGSNWNPTEIKFVLSGGEPLLHKDLGKIIALLSEYNAPIVVMTNGTLITDDYVKLFARYNVALEISLDSPDEEIHNQLRGEGCFQKTMAAIRRCQSVPSLIDKMTWRVTLFKGNKNSIHDIINMADEIGVKKVHFGTMEPVGRGTEYPNLILDDEERFNCFMQIHKASKECSSVSVLGDICSSFKVYGPYESNETHCQLGSSIRIDSDGNIYACQLFISPELRLGNIAEMSIASTDVRMGIERLNNIKNRRPQDIEACVKCVWKNFCCSGCMAKAFEQYGTFWEKDPQCGVFKRICSYNVCERLS